MICANILLFALVLMFLSKLSKTVECSRGVDRNRRETAEWTSAFEQKRREASEWTSGNQPLGLSYKLKRTELVDVLPHVNVNSPVRHSKCFILLSIDLVVHQRKHLRKVTAIGDGSNVWRTEPAPGDQNGTAFYIIPNGVPTGTHVTLKGGSSELIEKTVDSFKGICRCIYVSQQDLRKLNYNISPELEIVFPISLNISDVEIGLVM